MTQLEHPVGRPLRRMLWTLIGGIWATVVASCGDIESTPDTDIPGDSPAGKADGGPGESGWCPQAPPTSMLDAVAVFRAAEELPERSERLLEYIIDGNAGEYTRPVAIPYVPADVPHHLQHPHRLNPLRHNWGAMRFPEALRQPGTFAIHLGVNTPGHWEDQALVSHAAFVRTLSMLDFVKGDGGITLREVLFVAGHYGSLAPEEQLAFELLVEYFSAPEQYGIAAVRETRTVLINSGPGLVPQSFPVFDDEPLETYELGPACLAVGGELSDLSQEALTSVLPQLRRTPRDFSLTSVQLLRSTSGSGQEPVCVGSHSGTFDYLTSDEMEAVAEELRDELSQVVHRRDTLAQEMTTHSADEIEAAQDRLTLEEIEPLIDDLARLEDVVRLTHPASAARDSAAERLDDLVQTDLTAVRTTNGECVPWFVGDWTEVGAHDYRDVRLRCDFDMVSESVSCRGHVDDWHYAVSASLAGLRYGDPILLRERGSGGNWYAIDIEITIPNPNRLVLSKFQRSSNGGHSRDAVFPPWWDPTRVLGVAPEIPATGGEGTWHPVSEVDAPSKRSDAVAVWTGSEVLLWGGTDRNTIRNDGGRYDPDSDTWTTMAPEEAPTATDRSVRKGFWTGDELLLWGSDGSGRYDPDGDTWSRIADSPTLSVGVAYWSAQATWTGEELIVVSATLSGSDMVAARYSPQTDSWQPMSTDGLPRRLHGYTASWTGDGLLFWGGGLQSYSSSEQASGALYDLATDTWSPIAPSPRPGSGGLWTGGELVVRAKDMAYNPGTDSWRDIPASDLPPLYHLSGSWTGDDVLYWGGLKSWSGSEKPTQPFSAGAAYDPHSDTWESLPLPPMELWNQTHPGPGQSVVWLGDRLLVWGGLWYGANGGFSRPYTRSGGAIFVP